MPCPGWGFPKPCKIFIPYVGDLPFRARACESAQGDHSPWQACSTKGDPLWFYHGQSPRTVRGLPAAIS